MADPRASRARTQKGIRDQLRKERANRSTRTATVLGVRRRVSELTDQEIDEHARRESSRRAARAQAKARD